jgi:hypothetical protein
MIILTLIWFVIGAAAGWRLASHRTGTAASRVLEQAREQMGNEVRHWQEQTERIRAQADRMAREKDAWTAGYKQGREDVIKIVPHIAAQRGLLGQSVASESDEMNDCA